MSQFVGSVDMVEPAGTIASWSIDMENPDSTSKLAALVDGESVVFLAFNER